MSRKEHRERKKMKLLIGKASQEWEKGKKMKNSQKNILKTEKEKNETSFDQK
jgi:hypothetical protein